MLIRGKKNRTANKNRKLGHIQETWKQDLVKWLRYKNFQQKTEDLSLARVHVKMSDAVACISHPYIPVDITGKLLRNPWCMAKAWSVQSYENN